MTKYDETQQWYRDVDKFRDIKVFIYLSDVNNEKDGPFQLVKNSNNTFWFNPFNYSNRIKFRVRNEIIQKITKKIFILFMVLRVQFFYADTRTFHRVKPFKKNNYWFIFQLYNSIQSIGKNSQIMLDPNFESYPNWQKEIEKRIISQGVYSVTFKN